MCFKLQRRFFVMKNKKSKILFSLGAITLLSLTGASLLTSHSFSAFADDQTTYKHFNAVAPTTNGNGSKEYWSDCVGGDPLLVEPEDAIIVEGGTPSDEWVAALSTTDTRYVKPTKEAFDVERSGSLFTVTKSHGSTEAFNYYFFDTAASTAVVSMDIPVAFINGGGKTSLAGIVVAGDVTDGTDYEGDAGDRSADDYAALNIALETRGVKTYADNHWSKGRAPAEGWDPQTALYYDKTAAHELINDKTRELTVVLENNAFGVYIDGKFVVSIASSNTNYLNKAITSATYRFGVFFGAVSTNTQFTLKRELYGDDATSYIQDFMKYKMTNSGSNYVHQNSGTRSVSYMYLDNTFSTSIIAEVTSSASNVQNYNIGQVWSGFGFIFTDGETKRTADISSAVPNPPTDLKTLIVLSDYYGINLGSNFINCRNPSSWGTRGTDKFVPLLYNKSNKDQTITTDYTDGTDLTDVKITAVYHGGKIHAYVNGIYIAGYDINENNITYLGHGGTLPANAPLKVGLYSLGFNASASVTLTLNKYYAGAAADTEIAANYPEAL